MKYVSAEISRAMSGKRVSVGAKSGKHVSQENMPRWLATEAYSGRKHSRHIFSRNRAPKRSFTAIEAINRGLSANNFLLTFSEFPIFNENAIYYCDFVYFLNFRIFERGGSLKIRENQEIDQIHRGSVNS